MGKSPRGPHPGTSPSPLCAGLESLRPAGTPWFCSCRVPECQGCEEKPRTVRQTGREKVLSEARGSPLAAPRRSRSGLGPELCRCFSNLDRKMAECWPGKLVPCQRTCWAFIGRKRGLLYEVKDEGRWVVAMQGAALGMRLSQRSAAA